MARLGPAERRSFDAVRGLCAREMPVLELLSRSSDRLSRDLDADAYCSSQLDPATGLLLNSVSKGWPDEAKPLLVEHVFLRTPAASPYELFRQGHRAVTVDTLLDDTDDLPADPYFEHHLLPFGFRFEVQCMCAAEGMPQAILTFSRTEARGDFQPRHLRLLAALAPHVGRAVREARIRELLESDHGRGVGVLVLTDDGTIEVANQLARNWLDAAGHEDSSGSWEMGLPMFLRLVRENTDRLTEEPPPSWELINPADGKLYRVRVEVSPPGHGQEHTLFVMEPARLGDSPTLLRRIGLTEREAEVASELIRGASTSAIAGLLGCSPHTVNQHTRSIFSKLDVQSRAELAGVLLASTQTAAT